MTVPLSDLDRGQLDLYFRPGQRYVLSGRLAPPVSEGVSELAPLTDEPVEKHPYVAARLVHARDEPIMLKDHRMLLETVPLRFYDLHEAERRQVILSAHNRGVISVHGRWIKNDASPLAEDRDTYASLRLKRRMHNRRTWMDLAEDEPFMQVFAYFSGRHRLRRSEDGGFEHDFRPVPSILR